MRTSLRWLTLSGALLAGCGGHLLVTVPADPARASVYAGTAVLTATGAAWDGDPDDLSEHLVVVGVDVANQGPGAVRVAYTDFALTDETGYRYGAINPFAAAAVTGAAEPAEDAVKDGTLVAWRGRVVVRAPRAYVGPRVV